MKKIYRSILIVTLAALAGVTAAGCGKKEPQPEASQVIKLTITPEVTPTLAPEQINPDAVEKNGNLVMVNEYTAAEKPDSGEAVPADADAADSDTAGINPADTDAADTDTDAAEDESDEDVE